MNQCCTPLKMLILLAACMVIPLTASAADSEGNYGTIGGSDGKERPGAVVWMDLLTGDIDRAAEFYAEVFGWDLLFSGDRSYAYATVNGSPVAALATYEEEIGEADGLWIPSLSVPDVDKAMAVAKTLGGSVISPPEDLVGRGRYVLIEDATGAAIMLLRAANGDPARAEAPNQWLWAELWTDDVDQSIHFYEQVIGYGTVAAKDAEGQTFMVMGRDQQPHVSVVETPLPDVDPTWLAYLMVENVVATVSAIEDAGGSVLLTPQKDGFNDNVAIVSDPTGGVFALQQKEAR